MSVVGDSASAKLAQSLDAKGVSVTATGTSELTEKAVAGVSGGVKGKQDEEGSSGSTDKQIDKLLGSSAKLADKGGSKNMSADKLTGQTANRQKAQTSEGSVAGAGAVAVNVQKNRTSASILDGVDITAKGKLSVVATNRTVAQVSANASATKSDIGVGVGVGVNIVNVSNNATIGNGAINAAELEVLARMPEVEVAAKDPDGKKSEEDKEIETKAGFEKKVAELAKECSGKIFEAMGLGRVDFIESLEATFAETFTKDILSQPELAEVKNFLDGGNYLKKLTSAADKISGEFNALTERLRKTFTDTIEQNLYTGSMTPEQIQALVNEMISGTIESTPELAKKTVTDMLNDSKESLIRAALEMVKDGLTGKGWKGDKLTQVITNAMTSSLKQFGTTLVNGTIERLKPNLPLMTADNLTYAAESLMDTFESEIKGFVTYADETFRSDVFNYQKLIDDFAGKDLKEYAEKHIREALKKASVAVTNEMMDKALAKLDVGIEKPTAEELGDKHVITTEAVSGAGAKDVGVAGSVAVAVVNIDTKATIADSAKDMIVAGISMIQ